MQRAILRRRVERVFRPSLMGLLALGVIPLVILDFSANLGATGSLVTTIFDWTIIGVFFAEYACKLAAAESRWRYARDPWNILDLLIIVMPLAGLVVALRAGAGSNLLTSSPLIRLLRVVRVILFTGKSIQDLHLHHTLVRNRFYQIAGAATVIYFIVATVFFVVETDSGHAITYGDALWWGIGYITTIGSEIIPVTGAGRILGGVLMAVGLGFAGIFTANIVSYIQDSHRDHGEAAGTPPDAGHAATPQSQELLQR